MAQPKVDVSHLSGISETTLWTLYCRAREASHRHPVITDPLAVRMVDQIDYEFTRFEQHSIPKTLQQALRPTAQYFAVRAATFDRAIRTFLDQHPHATVLALAEGLQTTFWRINSPTVRWISLDLPDVISLREQLLPPNPQITHMPASALGPDWGARLTLDGPTLITAEGLLMYLQPGEALNLIKTCARHNPGGTMIFDAAPPAINNTVWQWTPRYRVPTMTFTLTSGQAAKLSSTIAEVESATPIPYVPGHGLRGRLQTILPRFPVLSYVSSSITRLQFHQRAQPDVS